MRAFYLIIDDAGSVQPRRIDFQAEGPDHAFQIARNETDGINVTLCEGERVLARMTKTTSNLLQLHSTSELTSAVLAQP